MHRHVLWVFGSTTEFERLILLTLTLGFKCFWKVIWSFFAYALQHGECCLCAIPSLLSFFFSFYFLFQCLFMLVFITSFHTLARRRPDPTFFLSLLIDSLYFEAVHHIDKHQGHFLRVAPIFALFSPGEWLSSSLVSGPPSPTLSYTVLCSITWGFGNFRAANWGLHVAEMCLGGGQGPMPSSHPPQSVHGARDRAKSRLQPPWHFQEMGSDSASVRQVCSPSPRADKHLQSPIEPLRPDPQL